MTKIVLVIIGIMLAAAAAIMTVFFGGDAYQASFLRAEAARLVNEGAQLTYATDFYMRQEGKLPGAGIDNEKAMADLVEKQYLSGAPKGMGLPKSAGEWRFDFDEGMIKSVVGPSSDEDNMMICVEARKQLQIEEPEKVLKCDGSDHPKGRLSFLDPCCIQS